MTARAPGRGLALACALIAAAGVVLRLSLQARGAADPLQGAALLDTRAYLDAAARFLADGPLAGAPFYRPPGYPWLLALVNALGGGAPATLALQALLDGGTALLVARVAFLGAGRGAALVAALAWSACPSPVAFSGELLEGTLAAFLVALAALLLWRAEERPRARAWSVAGFVVGCAGLVRPNLLLLAPLVGWRAGRASGARAALLALAACLLPLLPVAAANLRVGEPLLVSANGGVNLYLGNVHDPELHDAVPYYAALPGPVAGYAWERLGARAHAAVGPGAAAQSRWHAVRALHALAAHPARTARLLGAKALALLEGFELSNNRDLHRPTSPLSRAWLAPTSWGVLLPLAWAGAAVALTRGERRWRTHMAALLLLALGVVLFFVSARHRLPLLPLVVPLAALGLTSLRGAPRRLLPLVALGALVAWSDPLGQRPRYAGYVIDPVGRAQLHAAAGRTDAAAADLALALERDPRDVLALETRAALELATGQVNAAVRSAARATELAPERATAWNQLGLAFGYAGAPARALAALDRGAALAPDDPWLQANRGRALLDLGRTDEARVALERALAGLSDEAARLEVRNLLGRLPR